MLDICLVSLVTAYGFQLATMTFSRWQTSAEH